MKDLDFLDSQILDAYACLGLIFAGSSTVQMFQDGISSSFKEAKARIFVSTLYGEIVVFVLLCSGIVTVYVNRRGGYVPTPDWISLAKAATFGLSASLAIASLAALAAVRFSRRMAMICLRFAFFGLLVLFYFRGQSLPDVGLTGAIACLAVAGFLIMLLKRVCR